MSGENPLTTIAIIDDDPLSVEFLVMHLGVAGLRPSWPETVPRCWN